MGCDTVTNVGIPDNQFINKINPQIRSKRISLKNEHLTVGHMQQFASINTYNIRQLELEKCHINHETLQEFLKINFPSLTRLSLNDNQIGPIGCRMLSSAGWIKNLSTLSLNNNKIKDQGVKGLAFAQFAQLQDLSLSDNAITTDGVGALKGKIDSVAYLSLGGNKLNDQSVKLLVALNPSQMVYLKLSRNQLTDAGLKQLLNGGYKQLQVLLIQKNKIKEPKESYNRKDLFLFY